MKELKSSKTGKSPISTLTRIEEQEGVVNVFFKSNSLPGDEATLNLREEVIDFIRSQPTKSEIEKFKKGMPFPKSQEEMDEIIHNYGHKKSCVKLKYGVDSPEYREAKIKHYISKYNRPTVWPITAGAMHQTDPKGKHISGHAYTKAQTQYSASSGYCIPYSKTTATGHKPYVNPPKPEPIKMEEVMVGVKVQQFIDKEGLGERNSYSMSKKTLEKFAKFCKNEQNENILKIGMFSIDLNEVKDFEFVSRSLYISSRMGVHNLINVSDTVLEGANTKQLFDHLVLYYKNIDFSMKKNIITLTHKD